MCCTDQAREVLGSFVEFADETTLVISCLNAFEEEIDLTITMDDVARYYAEEARNLSSGCRTLARMTADWRYVDRLAAMALHWFKQINIDGMRSAAQVRGLQSRF